MFTSISPFFLILPAIFVALLVSFSGLALTVRDYAPVRWAAYGGMLGVAGVLVDFFRMGLAISSVMAVALHYCALYCFGRGFSSRHDVPSQWRASLIVGAIGVAVAVYGTLITHALELRVVAMGICGGIILGLQGRYLPRPARDPVDRYIFAFVVVLVVVYVLRGLLFGLWLTATLDKPFFGSTYTMWFYTSTGILSLGYLVTMMLAIGSDLIRNKAEEARRDPLTGLWNRRALSDWLLVPGDAADAVVSVILIDLDHFKRINDSFGHATGDKVLVAAAQALSVALADETRIARIGGEEFTVMTGLGDPAAIDRLAHRLLDAVAKAHYPGLPEEWHVTASIGWALVDWSTGGPEAAMRAADKAVYAAKAAGRARVCPAS